ncbi:MAG: lytic murein transglycosylase [Alphaproteobacteria bacterium]|nr:lytic murein transglycosylase [Alphaproteobacteria bacterium]
MNDRSTIRRHVLAGLLGLSAATSLGGIRLARAETAVASTDPDFAAWLKKLRAEAKTRGISDATLDAALSGVTPNARVIELDRKQPEKTMTFAQYIERVVPEERVVEGRLRFAANADLLGKVSQRFGVEPQYIVALWGIESDFGRRMGSFSVIEALVTLAYDGRRSAYFRRELLDALTILEQGHIAPANMLGSWAGAMGQAQFMPSSFLGHAYDFDGDGRRDIWSSPGDVFASAAKYLSDIGWRNGEGWGRAVRLPASLNASQAAADEKGRSLGRWHALGVRAAIDASWPDHRSKKNARLVLPGGGASPAYLVFYNFDVILRWNRSTYFAVAVGQLADRIAGR